VCRRIGIFLNNFARSRNPLSPFVDSVRSSRSPCPHAPTEKVSCCSRLREAAEFRSTKRWACEVISPRLLPRETPFLFPRFSKNYFQLPSMPYRQYFAFLLCSLSFVSGGTEMSWLGASVFLHISSFCLSKTRDGYDMDPEAVHDPALWSIVVILLQMI
jgi:hypothetical protein